MLSRLPPELRACRPRAARERARAGVQRPELRADRHDVEFLFRSELRGVVGLPCEVARCGGDDRRGDAAGRRAARLARGQAHAVAAEPEPPSGVTLRFARGGRVQCYIGGAAGWVGGSVAALWCAFARARAALIPRSLGDKAESTRPPAYFSRSLLSRRYREPGFPPNFFAPYQIQLDDGRLIFAPRIRPLHPRRARPGRAALEVRARRATSPDRGERRARPQPREPRTATRTARSIRPCRSGPRAWGARRAHGGGARS